MHVMPGTTNERAQVTFGGRSFELAPLKFGPLRRASGAIAKMLQFRTEGLPGPEEFEAVCDVVYAAVASANAGVGRAEFQAVLDETEGVAALVELADACIWALNHAGFEPKGGVEGAAPGEVAGSQG